MDIEEFKDSFETVKDFRQEHKVKHSLIDILFTAVIGTIANANQNQTTCLIVIRCQSFFKLFFEKLIYNISSCDNRVFSPIYIDMLPGIRYNFYSYMNV